MQKKNEVTMREAMMAMVSEYKLKSRFDENRVKTLWHERMGKTISTYTSDVTVRKHVLYLTILSAPLKQELSYSKEKIIAMINEEMGNGYVREVVIR